MTLAGLVGYIFLTVMAGATCGVLLAACLVYAAAGLRRTSAKVTRLADPTPLPREPDHGLGILTPTTPLNGARHGHPIDDATVYIPRQREPRP